MIDGRENMGDTKLDVKKRCTQGADLMQTLLDRMCRFVRCCKENKA